MDRRQFIASVPALAASASLSADERKPAMIRIIDTHEHLWDRSKIRLSWLKEGDKGPLASSHTPKEYAAAINGLGVVKSIYMEVDVVAADRQKEVEYVLDVIKSGKTPMVAAVVGGDPAEEGFAKYAEQFKGSPHVKGIRRVIHTESTATGYSLSKPFIAGVQRLGELGLMFDICIRPAELGDAAKLVDACPDTRFILDHCGNGSATFTAEQFAQWKKDMTALGTKKNLVCKVSGVVASTDQAKPKAEQLAPLVNHTIEAFGWDRVMFGGDWPVCTKAATYAEWVAALKEIVAEFAPEKQQKLFADNAERQYGLKA